ncbi:MAG: hypothetical protein N2Z23_11265, partial [Pyrinomonadaceae bacterium]|nr:hypothetical protein [Pyrinomonadaceae bacterium]
PRARWRPKFLTKGQGLLEIVQHAAPFSSKPERTLKILEKALHSAIIIKGSRGEASLVSKSILGILGEEGESF